jgi:hypothetical protein
LALTAGSITESTNARVAAVDPAAKYPPSAPENDSAKATTSMTTTAGYTVLAKAPPSTIRNAPTAMRPT